MRTYVLTLLATIVLATGCCSVDKLEPAHKMGLENNRNLEKNVHELTRLYLKMVKAQPDYTEEKAADWIKLAAVTTEQMAIDAAYMALLDVFIKGKDISAGTFKDFMGEIPTLILEGKNIYDEAKKAFEKEE